MTDDLTALLTDSLTAVRPLDGGELPDEPPALAQADPDLLAVSAITTDGRRFGAGDTEHEFSIQSISKALVYAMVLQEHGWEAVAAKVGLEPSGEAFDAVSVEAGTGRPKNPMINAGALTIHALLGGAGADADARAQRVVQTFSALAGRRLDIDREVHESELAGADANLATAYRLRSLQVLPDDPYDVVDGYLRQCAVSVTTHDLVMMGATLAAGGVQPQTGRRIFSADVVRRTLSVMLTCGMYDAAGDWVSQVGVPAKSGVGGGILGVMPGHGALATFSPRLDEHGNSVRGVALFERLSPELGLHFVDGLHEDDRRWEELTRG